MGIQGLTTVVSYYEQNLFRRIKLEKTKLVIDGDNLIHFLYQNEGINLNHGGDYNVFAEKIESFFLRLLSNKIKPYCS